MDTYLNDQTQTKKNPAGFLSGIFVGGVAGALTMLFIAPQSGKETRKQIQQKALDLRNQATTTLENTLSQVRARADQLKADVEDKAKSLKQQSQDVLVDQLDRVSEAAKNGKKLIQGKAQKMNEHA